jgi:hypothetical protein
MGSVRQHAYTEYVVFRRPPRAVRRQLHVERITVSKSVVAEHVRTAKDRWRLIVRTRACKESANLPRCCAAAGLELCMPIGGHDRKSSLK